MSDLHIGTATLHVKAATRTLLASTIAYALSLLTGLLVARYTGPYGRGTYNGVQLAASVFATIPTGISSAFAYETLRRHSAFAELLPAFKVLLAGLFVAGWCGIAVWAIAGGWSIELIALAVAVPAVTLLACQQNVYVALGRLRSLNNQVAALALATLLAVIVAVVAKGGNATAPLSAWIVTSSAAGIVVAVTIGRADTGGRSVPVRAGLRRLLGRGSISSLSGLMSTLNYRVDAVLVIVMLGRSQFGVYSVAFGIVEMLLLIPRSFTTAVSREIGARDPSRSARLTARSTRAMTIVTAMAALVLFFVAPPVIHILLGPQFDGSAMPLRILLVGIIALASNVCFSAFFVLHRGRPMVPVAVNTIMACGQAGLCLVLIPRFGLDGAALAATSTYIVGAVINSTLLCKSARLSPADIWVLRRSDIEVVTVLMTNLRNSPGDGKKTVMPRIDPVR